MIEKIAIKSKSSGSIVGYLRLRNTDLKSDIQSESPNTFVLNLENDSLEQENGHTPKLIMIEIVSPEELGFKEPSVTHEFVIDAHKPESTFNVSGANLNDDGDDSSNNDKLIESLEKELEVLKAKLDHSQNLDTENKAFKAQIQELVDEKNALSKQIEDSLSNNIKQEGEDPESDNTVDSLHAQNNQLRRQLAINGRELLEAKEKVAKTSSILTQSLEKFKNKESALKKSLEELEDVKQLAHQQGLELAELKSTVRDSVKQSSDRKPKKQVEEISESNCHEHREIFASMVQISLEKLKIVSKILNAKSPSAGVISSSLEKVKAAVVDKRNEDDALPDFDKKLKTHFWNIHEVYLSILAKQIKKTETSSEEIDQLRTLNNKNMYRLSYAEDLVKKFIKLESKDRIHKEIIMAIVDVFTTNQEEKEAFVKNLKSIQA